MTVPDWRLTQPERDVLAEAMAHPRHEVTAGDAGWSLVRRGLLTLTFGGAPEDIAASIRPFKLTEAGELVAQGRLDFSRDKYSLWHPVLDGEELLDISRCHQREVCEVLGRYLRGWMLKELKCLDDAFGQSPRSKIKDADEILAGLSTAAPDELIGPFPQEPAFESPEAIERAADIIAHRGGQ